MKLTKISVGVVVWAFNGHGPTLMLVAADEIKPMQPIHRQIQSTDFSGALQLDGYESTDGIVNAATDTMEQQQERKLYGQRTQDVTGKRTQELVKQNNKRIPPISTPRTRPEHYRPTKKDWNSNRGKKKKQDRKWNKDDGNEAGEQLLSRGGSSRQSRNKDGRRGRPRQQTQATEHTASKKRRKKKDKKATRGD